jgi:hypothetical protein
MILSSQIFKGFLAYNCTLYEYFHQVVLQIIGKVHMSQLFLLNGIGMVDGHDRASESCAHPIAMG